MYFSLEIFKTLLRGFTTLHPPNNAQEDAYFLTHAYFTSEQPCLIVSVYISLEAEHFMYLMAIAFLFLGIAYSYPLLIFILDYSSFT